MNADVKPTLPSLDFNVATPVGGLLPTPLESGSPTKVKMLSKRIGAIKYQRRRWYRDYNACHVNAYNSSFQIHPHYKSSRSGRGGLLVNTAVVVNEDLNFS
jgi:hypothetical protein